MLAVVIIASLVPVPAPPMELPGGFDKYEHVFAYAMLSGYFGQLFTRTALHMRAAVALIALGGLLEVLQGQTSYRSADPFDLLANTLGVLAGFFACRTVLGTLVARLDLALPARLGVSR
jgi:VanZ family protein